MPSKRIYGYLWLIAQLFTGLLLIVTVKALQLPSWLPAPFLLLFLFWLLNRIAARLLNLKSERLVYWDPYKLYFALIGTIIGAIIASLPILFAIISDQAKYDFPHANTDIGLQSIVITLAIAGWEELWFRGLLLNYSAKRISIISISISIGILFMLVHLLNPEFSIIHSGSALFFAGTFLTMTYFVHKNIWLPLGLHFGNNFYHRAIESNLEGDIWYGNDGYLSAIILGGLCIIYGIVLYKKNL